MRNPPARVPPSKAFVWFCALLAAAALIGLGRLTGEMHFYGAALPVGIFIFGLGLGARRLVALNLSPVPRRPLPANTSSRWDLISILRLMTIAGLLIAIVVGYLQRR